MLYQLNGPAYAGVVCSYHGKVDIDKEEYNRQMSRPNSLWRCPVCGESCDFDDDRYEQINF